MSVALWLLAAGLLLLPGRRVRGSHRPRARLRAWSPRRLRVAVGRPRPLDVSDLPAVLDLAAVALRSGAPPGPAIGAAASAADGDLRAVLVGVAGLLTLGVEPAAAWADARAVPDLAGVALLAERSGTSGARLATVLAATAATLRDDALVEGRRVAARVGVWSVLPLGLCFLPAFVCVGIVPAVVGIARGMAGTGVF